MPWLFSLPKINWPILSVRPIVGSPTDTLPAFTTDIHTSAYNRE